MKKIRDLAQQHQRTQLGLEEKSQTLVFYNKATGVAQFRTESKPGELESAERAAGMLAIQCLVRGHDPDDFVVLVPAEGGLCSRLLSRAKELLHEGRSIAAPAPLSPRQKEILQSVLRQQANKEIASRLNITVRTVKFHVSQLLSKFDVQSRGELAQKAAGMFGGEPANPEPIAHSEPPAAPPGFSPVHGISAREAARVGHISRTVRFPGRMRTA